MDLRFRWRLPIQFLNRKTHLRRIYIRLFVSFQARTLWLNLAVKTREDLRTVGIEPVYTSVLLDFERGVDFGQKGYLAQKRETLSPIDQLRWDFAFAFNKAVHFN